MISIQLIIPFELTLYKVIEISDKKVGHITVCLQLAVIKFVCTHIWSEVLHLGVFPSVERLSDLFD